MVPNGWSVFPLDQVSKIIDCKHRTPKYVKEGIPLVSPGTIKWGPIDLDSPTKRVTNEEYASLMDHCSVDIGDLVLSRNQSVGIASYVDKSEPFVLGQDTVLVKPNGCDASYLFYNLQSVNTQRTVFKLAGGSTFSRINLGEIRKLKSIYPPLPEQRKIAQILSTWDRGIATTEKLIDASKQQKKALMQQLLTGKKRLVDPETGKAFEGEWEEVRLIDTVSKEKYSFTGGPFGSDLKSSDYTENGVRIIQLQNIGDGTFHNSYQIFTSQEKADELVSCNIFPDDIIISKMGDPVARATLIPHIHQRYLMASDGIRLAIDKSKYNNRFILETINYREFRNNALAKSTGSTRRRIGLTDLKNIKFRVPELIEQQKIASVLTAADNEVELLEAKLAHLKQEKKALMQQLLTGKRRVNIAEIKVATEETLEVEVA
ncbi:TPA: restriction endonuclease subunit S [Photobacterium damselae]